MRLVYTDHVIPFTAQTKQILKRLMDYSIVNTKSDLLLVSCVLTP